MPLLLGHVDSKHIGDTTEHRIGGFMVNMTRRKMFNGAAIGAGGLAAAAAIVPARDLAQSGNDAGHGVFECHHPSTTFGQFGDERVTAVARGLDAAPARLARGG
jgi:hypothetical protein